jgi:hypothetical protein
VGVSKDREHLERETGDDPGKNEWEKNDAAEKRFTGEIGAIESERGKEA